MPNPHYAWPLHLLKRTSQPDDFVTLQECKSHLDVSYDDDDDLIQGYLDSAIASLDAPNGMVGKAIATQSWEWKLPRQSGNQELFFPILPFRDVRSISYYDTSNVLVQASLSDFEYFGNEDYGTIEPVNFWPQMYDRRDALTILFDAGFGDPVDCPPNLKQACKMLVAHWYENREGVSDMAMQELPLSVQSMVDLSRIGWVK